MLTGAQARAGAYNRALAWRAATSCRRDVAGWSRHASAIEYDRRDRRDLQLAMSMRAYWLQRARLHLAWLHATAPAWARRLP